MVRGFFQPQPAFAPCNLGPQRRAVRREPADARDRRCARDEDQACGSQRRTLMQQLEHHRDAHAPAGQEEGLPGRNMLPQHGCGISGVRLHGVVLRTAASRAHASSAQVRQDESGTAGEPGGNCTPRRAGALNTVQGEDGDGAGAQDLYIHESAQLEVIEPARAIGWLDQPSTWRPRRR